MGPTCDPYPIGTICLVPIYGLKTKITSPMGCYDGESGKIMRVPCTYTLIEGRFSDKSSIDIS